MKAKAIQLILCAGMMALSVPVQSTTSADVDNSFYPYKNSTPSFDGLFRWYDHQQGKCR